MRTLAVAFFLLLLAGVLVTPLEQPAARALAQRCSCGPVDFAVADEFVVAANCECPDCQGATEAAFIMLRDALIRISGRLVLQRTGR